MTVVCSHYRLLKKMASARVLTCVILSLFHIVCGSVPVLVWESSKSDRINSFPALKLVQGEEFLQWMMNKMHGSEPPLTIVGFVGDSLSIEDFSLKDSQGKGFFPNVEYMSNNAGSTTFFPRVTSPDEALQQLAQFAHDYTVFEIDSTKNLDLHDGCSNIFIVKLQEAKSDEDRPDLLRRQDVKMAEIYSQLLSKCSHVIAILMGKQSSWVEPEEIIRLRRSIDNTTSVIPTTSNMSYTLYQDPKGYSLLYSKSVPKLINEGKDISLGNYSVVVTGDNSKPTEIKLYAKYGTDRLGFIFDNMTTGYWYLRNVTVEVGGTEIALKSSMDIVAPLGKSWHSGSPVTFKNNSTSLTFSDLQVQPFFLKPGSNSFDDAVDAVEFFTPAIWSGLFVTFLLAIIFTWGLSMIMDIRTMDQFDDPKGKTITVSATD